MRKIAAVAALEISERAIVLPVALLLGGLPFLIGAFRRHAVAGDVRSLSAVFLALLAGGALAVTFGFWSTGGDVASRRTAFFLARPLSPFELWAGKAAGSLSIVFGTVVVVLLPVALAGDPLRESIAAERIPSQASIAVAGTALVAIFLLSQAAGVAALARSPWLLVNLVFCAGAVAIAFSLARTLVGAHAETALAWGGAALLAGLLIALAWSGHEAVRRGRVDLRLAARAQSIAFWSLAAGLIAVSAVGAAWVVGATPSDIRRVDWATPAARGDWMTVTGPAKWRGGYRPVFFENARTGEFIRVRPFFRSRLPVISSDGRRAAWTSAVPGLGEPTLTPRTVTLDPKHPDRVAWETKDLHEDPLLVFSSDSSRLAVISAERITVWDAVRGRMLAAARPPFPLWEHARGFTFATFAGNDTLRVYSIRLSPDPSGGRNRSVLDILELDVAARRLRRTGGAGPFVSTFPILTDTARRRLLLRDGPSSIVLLDARTGATLRTFAGGAAVSRSADFLSDGRIALFESPGGAGRVVVLSPEGEREREISVGAAERAYILGERPAGALLIVAGSRAELNASDGRVLVVDLSRNSVRPWAEHLSPVAPYARFMAGDPGAIPEPGSLATRLFFTRERALVELEAPGRIRQLFPAR